MRQEQPRYDPYDKVWKNIAYHVVLKRVIPVLLGGTLVLLAAVFFT